MTNFDKLSCFNTFLQTYNIGGCLLRPLLVLCFNVECFYVLMKASCACQYHCEEGRVHELYLHIKFYKNHNKKCNNSFQKTARLFTGSPKTNQHYSLSLHFQNPFWIFCQDDLDKRPENFY